MNLSNLKFWKQTPDSKSDEIDADPLNNVVQLPLVAPADQSTSPASPAFETDAPLEPIAKVNNLTGLMAEAEIQDFFGNNFFGLGRYDGAHYKTQDSQIRGEAALVSRFQNAVARVIGRMQTKVDGLRNMELQIEGVCKTATGQLRLACTRLERDMTTLHEQRDLAEHRQGWVLASLNEYRIGFGKGVREAIDAELLGL